MELHDRIAQQARSCKEMRQPPVLKTEEMLQLASRNPNNDILDFEELCTGDSPSQIYFLFIIRQLNL